MQTIQREITAPLSLCDASGRLNPKAAGWSRQPLHQCNLSGRFLRKKKWDYWCVTSNDLLFSATISNLDYAAAAFIYILDFGTKDFGEATEIIPLPRKLIMPEGVYGDQEFRRGGIVVRIRSTTMGVALDVEGKSVAGHPLAAQIRVERPPNHESLNVVVPWNASTFQFTSKQHAMPASGRVRWGGREYNFDAADSFACLDFGRGIWPFSTSWNWGAFSARIGRDTIGVNMGARWTDGTGMNENGIIYNGRLTKVFSDMRFEHDGNLMNPWRIRTTESDEIDFTFTPFFHRKADTNLLILRTNVSQMIGRYTGTVKVGSKRISVIDAPGWAEEHFARW